MTVSHKAQYLSKWKNDIKNKNKEPTVNLYLDGPYKDRLYYLSK